MKKILAVSLAILLALGPAGCFGPQKCSRQLDDWLQQGYVDTPWLYGNAAAWGLIFLGRLLTGMADGLVVNPMDFWGASAWPFGYGTGTPFRHRAPRVPSDP